MIQQRHELPNGNVFIWLGNQTIQECEHVLILAGGDVKLLKTVETVTFRNIMQDLGSLSKVDFLKKQRWPNNSSGDALYSELKNIHSQ
jgi:hypothetical protein